MGLDLSSDRFVTATVGRASSQRSDLLLIHPGRPDSSYLVMKLEGAHGIKGMPMPLARNPLPADEIATIKEWINQLAGDKPVQIAGVEPEVYPFLGWKVANLPTNRMVPRGNLLFLIGHRFNPSVSSGYDAFYGMDGSSVIFLNLGYAVTDRLAVSLGRSNADDDVEFGLRNRFVRQERGGSPLSVGAHSTLNWFSEKPSGGSRFRREAFKLGTQLVLSRGWGTHAGFAVVPGVLFNPSTAEADEPPLVTLGLGGRWRFQGNMALVAEWVPILSGYTRTRTFGNDNRFDSWAGGLEVATAGHVFQIVVTNSVGVATDQYLRGGDLDIRERDVRLGFNIFRAFNL